MSSTSRLARAGRLLRTLRHLRPQQALAQALFAVRGVGRPVRLSEPAPELHGGAAAGAVPSASGATLPDFLPAPAHARWQGARRVELLGRCVDFGSQIDWDFAGEGPLWTYHLHQCDYLRGTHVPPRARSEWILDWIGRCRGGAGWDPHPLSLRILAWGKLLAIPGALALSGAEQSALRHSLACQVETLARHPEVRLQANHLLSNRLGVVFGGLLFEGPRADRWLSRERLLRREIALQILPDGTHFERSPMYHSLLLENVLDLLRLARGTRARAPASLVAALEDAASRMLGALEVLCHPDGEIALFADSAFEVAQSPAALVAYAGALGVAPRRPRQSGVLEDAGYVRLESAGLTLIASVAGPMPAFQPGHAHCDALSFELSCGDERVVTDTGVLEYIPGPLRDLARATRSHATVEVGGREQAETWAAHRIGGRPRVRLESVVAGERAEATCAGWATPDSVHRREFRVVAGGFELRDRIEGRARPVRLTLPIAPGLEPRLSPAGPGREGPASLDLTLARGRLRVTLPAGVRWRLERAAYFPRFGDRRRRACLVGEAEVFDEGVWRFEAR